MNFLQMSFEDLMKQILELKEEINLLTETINQQQENNICGINFPSWFVEKLDIVFNSPVISSKEELITEVFGSAFRNLNQIVELRKELAITGAMRWSSSQEAPINAIDYFKIHNYLRN